MASGHPGSHWLMVRAQIEWNGLGNRDRERRTNQATDNGEERRIVMIMAITLGFVPVRYGRLVPGFGLSATKNIF